eukprot:TRINITY_DN5435_c0_g1_i2.p1 TRINITY_DN5435_c0_g1~~TRINITY_DN5435_c0_g1_i2.p1  ORF type:complete len:698 (+),score=103.72 TRINITY_DN5435_c0_g1_i2:121-2214(+)
MCIRDSINAEYMGSPSLNHKKINYAFQCKLVKLNRFSSVEQKQYLRSSIEEFRKITLQKFDKLILLLDGFDEFGEKKEDILELVGIKSQSEQLQQRTKIIITCQSTQITEEQQKQIFYVKGKSELTNQSYLVSNTKDKLLEFTKQFVDIMKTYSDFKFFGKINTFQTSDQYKALFDSSKDLYSLISQPFFLRLILIVLPVMQEKNKNSISNNNRITQYEWLELFVDQWIENTVFYQLNQQEKEQIAQEIPGADPNKLQDKRTEILKLVNSQALKIIYYLWEQNLVSINFFSEQVLTQVSQRTGKSINFTTLMIKCIPVTQSEGEKELEYEFLHKSILDYYLCKMWLSEFLTIDKALQISDLNISKQYIRPQEFPSLLFLKEYILEQSNREEIEVSAYSKIIDSCLLILDASKSKNFTNWAGSSNAITILNFLRFQFTELDLSYIKVKNAYLDLAIFRGANLQYAQIQDSVLTRADLRDCDLEHAKFQNIDLAARYSELSGSKNRITSVAISSDGKSIISGTADNTINIWDLANENIILTLVGHSKEVTSVAVSLDGRYIVSGSIDCTIKIWSAETGLLVNTLLGHSDRINSVAISSNNKFIVSGSGDRSIRIWSVQNNGTQIIKLNGHDGQVTSVAITQDAKYIVSGSEDGNIKVWCFETGKETMILVAENSIITTVAVSSDGQYIVSGDQDCLIRI